MTFGKKYTAYSVPTFGNEDDDFKSRYMLCPFFADLKAVEGIGRIFYRIIDRNNDETLSDDNDLLSTDDIIKTTQKLSSYRAEVVVKITWSNVTEFGGSMFEVNGFSQYFICFFFFLT